MKVLIVEDNLQDALYMTEKIAKNGFTTIDPVDSVKQAKKVITEEAPDIVIFDYEIRGGFGTDVVEYFIAFSQENSIDLPFHFAFLSAHEADLKEKIFDLNHPNFVGAYLKTDFEVAIDQISSKFEHYRDTISKPTDLVRFVGIHEKQQDRLILKDGNICYVIELTNILYLQGEAGYTTIYWLDNGKVQTQRNVAKSLTSYQQSLAEKYFQRISRSHLINLSHLIEFDNRNTSYVKLEHVGYPLSVTRGYESDLKNAVGLVNV